MTNPNSVFQYFGPITEVETCAPARTRTLVVSYVVGRKKIFRPEAENWDQRGQNGRCLNLRRSITKAPSGHPGLERNPERQGILCNLRASCWAFSEISQQFTAEL